MKLAHSAFSAKMFKILVLCLFTGTNTVWAEHIHQHSGAPTFSDPTVLSEVSKQWIKKAVTHDDTHLDADLVVALGQQSYPLFKDLINEYAKKNKLKIVIKPGTCGITAGRLRKKSVDVGAYCCPPGKSDRLPGLEFHSLGISPIALIVHPDNPLTNLSSKQAKDIFNGQTSRWSQLKNSKTTDFQHRIKPVARLHCKVRPGHWRGLLKDEDQFSPRLFEVGVIPDMISQVSNNIGAIGWEVPLMVSFHKKKGLVRMLQIDGHAATDLDYVLTGKYPLYRSYSLTTWNGNGKTEKNPHAMNLVRYLQQHIEKIHSEISYIPPSRLRSAGWQFRGEELIGEPATSVKITK